MSKKIKVIVFELDADQIKPLVNLIDSLDGLQTNLDLGEKETVVDPEVKPKRQTRKPPRSIKRKSTPQRMRRIRRDSSIGTARETIAENSNLPLESVHLFRPDGGIFRDDEKIGALRKEWEGER